jgi:hypothetical protein
MAIERDLADESDRVLDADARRILAMTPEERERELVEAGFDLDEVYAEANALYDKMLALDAQDAPLAGAPVAASDVAPSSGALATGDDLHPVIPIARARSAAATASPHHTRTRRWPWALAACFLLLATAVAAFEADRITALRTPAPSPDAPQLELAPAATVPRPRKPPVGPDGLPRHQPWELGERGQLDLADSLRKDAAQLCESGQWDECRDFLDKARRLDPDGEGTDQVKRLRARVESAQPRPGTLPAAPSARPKEK